MMRSFMNKNIHLPKNHAMINKLCTSQKHPIENAGNDDTRPSFLEIPQSHNESIGESYSASWICDKNNYTDDALFFLFLTSWSHMPSKQNFPSQFLNKLKSIHLLLQNYRNFFIFFLLKPSSTFAIAAAIAIFIVLNTFWYSSRCYVVITYMVI